MARGGSRPKPKPKTDKQPTTPIRGTVAGPTARAANSSAPSAAQIASMAGNVPGGATVNPADRLLMTGHSGDMSQEQANWTTAMKGGTTATGYSYWSPDGGRRTGEGNITPNSPVRTTSTGEKLT